MTQDVKNFRLDVRRTSVKPEHCYVYAAEGKVLKDRGEVTFNRTRAGAATGKSEIKRKIELLGPDWVSDIRSLLSNTTLARPNPAHMGGTSIRVALRSPTYFNKLTPSALRTPPSKYPVNSVEWAEFTEALQAVADNQQIKPFKFLRIARDQSKTEFFLLSRADSRKCSVMATSGSRTVENIIDLQEYKRLRVIFKILPVGGEPSDTPINPGLYFDPGNGKYFEWDTQVCDGQPDEEKEKALAEVKNIVQSLNIAWL